MNRRNKTQFGTKVLLGSVERPLLVRRLTPHSDDYELFGRTICRRKPSRAAQEAAAENERLMLANAKILDEPLPHGKNARMLFIVDMLDAVGGVEARLFKILNYLEKNIDSALLADAG